MPIYVLIVITINPTPLRSITINTPTCPLMYRLATQSYLPCYVQSYIVIIPTQYCIVLQYSTVYAYFISKIILNFEIPVSVCCFSPVLPCDSRSTNNQGTQYLMFFLLWNKDSVLCENFQNLFIIRMSCKFFDFNILQFLLERGDICLSIPNKVFR